MVERDLRLVELTGARYHVAHISTAAAIDAVRRAKARGPAGHRRGGAAPFRAERARGRGLPHLRQGLAAACAPRATGGRWSRACATARSTRSPATTPAGPGQQAAAVRPGRVRRGRPRDAAAGLARSWSTTGALGLLDLLAKLTCRPAELLGIEAGRLRTGAPADLVLFDPEAPARIREDGPALPVQEHAVRGPPGAGQGAAHAGRRPHDLPGVRPAAARGWVGLADARTTAVHAITRNQPDGDASTAIATGATASGALALCKGLGTIASPRGANQWQRKAGRSAH